MLTMLVCFTATAGIYKWVDKDGNIHYSDQEVKGAEQVELSKTITFTPTKTDTPTDTDTPPDELPAYSEISIVQPKMNETIRNNNGNVEVKIKVVEELSSQDSITLYLDGKEVRKGMHGTSTTLSQVERGSHTLRASVLDKNGVSLISSSSIIFHLKIETEKPKEEATKDNSEAFTPDFNNGDSEDADYSKDFTKDYTGDFTKDHESSGSYEEGATKFNNGIPSNSGNFKSGTGTYAPNFNQKK